METNCFNEIFPKKFEYVVIESSFESAEKFTCILRVKISNADDFYEWLRLFEKLTNTNWNVRTTRADSHIYAMSRNFVCHHSSFHKITSKRRCESKNKTCGAKLSIRIKRNTRRVRYRDKYTREGYLGVIRINFIHSHVLNSAESLRWLRTDPEIKEKFLKLFDSGFSPAEAIRFHQKEISKTHPKEVANRRMNPTKRWVYDTHTRWLLQKDRKDSVLVSAKNNDQNNDENWKCTIIKDEVISEDELNDVTDDDHNSICSGSSSMQAEEFNVTISRISGAQTQDELTNTSSDKSTTQGSALHLIRVKEDCAFDNNKKYRKILSKDAAPRIAPISQTVLLVGLNTIGAGTSNKEIKPKTAENSCNVSSDKTEMEPTTISNNISGAQMELLSNFQTEFDRIVGLLKHNIGDKKLYNLAEKYIQKLKRVDTSEQLHSFLVRSILSFHSDFDHNIGKQKSIKQEGKIRKNNRTKKIVRQSISPYQKKIVRQSISPYHKKLKNQTNCKGV